MKFRSLLSPCSATISAATDDDTTAIPFPHKSPPPPSTSYNLYTNLSLQTLPSVPSLQNHSPEPLNLAISHTHITSLNSYPAAHVNSLAVNNRLLYAASGNLVHVFDTKTFSLLDVFSSNDSSSGSVKSVTFHNGKIFTSHQDSKIRVWKLTENKRHKHAATLPTVQDRVLRSVLNKNYVNVRRHRRRLWIEHHDAVTGLAGVNNELMCSVSWDRYLKIWKTSSMRCVESVKAHEDAINAVVVAGDGTIYTGSADRRIKVWRKMVGENKNENKNNNKNKYGLVATLEKHKSVVNALALNGDGSVLFSGACDRSILVWEKEDSAKHMVVTGALRGHGKAILCLINVSDLLFSGSADGTVRIWRRGGEGRFCCLNVLDGHKEPVRSLVASVDSCLGDESASGIKVFSGSFGGEIKIWKVEVSKL